MNYADCRFSYFDRKAVILVRIEKIEFNKIKVTVSEIDLNNMNINIKNLKPDSPQLHNFLFKIMEMVKKETDFNPYTGQIVVEALPTNDSIILTVTKVSEEKPVISDIAKGRIKPKKIRAVIKEKSICSSVFYFDDFETLCNAIVHLSRRAIKTASYFKSENSYALTFEDLSNKDLLILKEFTDNFEINNSLAEHFLTEHSQLKISGDEFVSMADGLIKLYNAE